MKVLITGFAALAMACAILPADDDPLTTNYNALQAALAAKKGAAEIKRLSVLVLTEAKKEMAPAPPDADKDNYEDPVTATPALNAVPAPPDADKDNYEAHVKYATQVAEQAEYALYAASLGAPSATAVDLISTLEAQAPKSKYLTQDAYLMVANAALTAQEMDRASSFAKKALTASKGAKPEQATGDAHLIIGVAAFNKKDLTTADKEIRAALAGIKGTPAMEGPAYYYLGEADYSLGRQGMDRSQTDQGIKFILQSAIISGPFQSGAAAEARRMKGEMGEK